MVIRQITWLFIVILCVGCNPNGPEKDVGNPGLTFDKVRLADLQDRPIDPAPYKGKAVFLNIWATWCKPCMAEMPSIQAAQQLMQNEEIVFLLASAESTEEINFFKNAHNYPFEYTRIENSEELGIQGLPTTFIFDREGRLLFTETGARHWDEKENIDRILKMLKKND